MEAQTFAALLQLLEVALIDCAPAFAALAAETSIRAVFAVLAEIQLVVGSLE